MKCYTVSRVDKHPKIKKLDRVADSGSFVCGSNADMQSLGGQRGQIRLIFRI